MEKLILLEQLDDRIKKALAIIVTLYPKVYAKELEEEDVTCLLSVIDSLKSVVGAVADIQYNDGFEKYAGMAYANARKEYEIE